MHVHTAIYSLISITGVPKVHVASNVMVDIDNIHVYERIITLTLRWEEQSNNLDPIVNYTVSCSGDITFPPSFITTENTIATLLGENKDMYT